MNMRVGMLDHYNVSTRKLDDTVRFYEEVLGLKNGPRPPSIFRAHGSTAKAIRFCISTISRPPIGFSQRIPGSSTMLRSGAAASRPSSSISARETCRSGSMRCPTARDGKSS